MRIEYRMIPLLSFLILLLQQYEQESINYRTSYFNYTIELMKVSIYLD